MSLSLTPAIILTSLNTKTEGDKVEHVWNTKERSGIWPLDPPSPWYVLETGTIFMQTFNFYPSSVSIISIIILCILLSSCGNFQEGVAHLLLVLDTNQKFPFVRNYPSFTDCWLPSFFFFCFYYQSRVQPLTVLTGPRFVFSKRKNKEVSAETNGSWKTKNLLQFH